MDSSISQKPATKAKRRPVKKTKPKPRPKPRSYSPKDFENLPPIVFGRPFNIFPATVFEHPRLESLMCFVPKGITEEFDFWKRWKQNPFPPTSYPCTPPDTLTSFWSPQLAAAIRRAVYRVRHLRFALRKFLHHWRVNRLQKANSEDIVTGSAPKHTIKLVDWASKHLYTFEASTLMRDITTRLQEHDGFFEDPQPPRNPFTNLPLTQSQLISVWNQVSHAPTPASAVFSEFRRVRYNFDRFAVEYRIPLQLHAFKQTMRNPTHEDYKERLLDFIQYAYDQESIDCYVQSYHYAIHEYPTHEILKSWAKLCTEFYEASILHERNTQLMLTAQDCILGKTLNLLPKQDELRLLRNVDLGLTPNRRVRARRHPQPQPQQEVAIVIAQRTVEEAAEQITDFLNGLLEGGGGI